MEGIPIETLIVDQNIIPELQCGICLHIVNKPRSCKNGHLFCLECITISLKRSFECPECRSSLTLEGLSRSLFVEKHIRSLNVYCKNHFKNELNNWIIDNQGCNETFTLENSTKHELECEYSFEPCKLNKDCGQFRKRNLIQHNLECPKRLTQCIHCKINYSFVDLQKHYLECEMIEIECQSCNIKLIKKELDNHKLNSCPNFKIQCPFFENGCLKSFDRKELQKHIDKSLGEHLILMKSSIQSMKLEFSNLLNLKDEKIKSLERLIKDKNSKIEWIVRNYSQLKKQGYIQSKKFSIGGFQFFIGFYTDGDSSDSKGYISIYLFLDTTHIPKGKTMSLEYYLKFCNQRDPNQSVTKEFRTTFPIPSPNPARGWGDRRAIRTSVLESNGFLKDDTLYIKSEIKVTKTTWLIDGSE